MAEFCINKKKEEKKRNIALKSVKASWYFSKVTVSVHVSELCSMTGSINVLKIAAS